MGHVGNKQAFRLLSYSHVCIVWLGPNSHDPISKLFCLHYNFGSWLSAMVSIQILIIFPHHGYWLNPFIVFLLRLSTQEVNYFGFSPHTPWEPVAARICRYSSLSCPFPTMAFNKPNVTRPFLSPRLILLFTPALITATFDSGVKILCNIPAPKLDLFPVTSPNLKPFSPRKM